MNPLCQEDLDKLTLAVCGTEIKGQKFSDLGQEILLQMTLDDVERLMPTPEYDYNNTLLDIAKNCECHYFVIRL